ELYDEYRNSFREKSMFYKTYNLQGVGDKDLSKVVLETALKLVTEGGTISMVVPSQILSSVGSKDIRKELLEKNIRQLYVFENKKNIFPIHASYRFLLLTLKNEKGTDKFPAGFYLHRLESLENQDIEKEKFGTLSKKNILKMSPTCAIPEILGESLKILLKLASKNPLGGGGLEDGTQVLLSRGFDVSNDADIFTKNGSGWPVHEGKTIHQYNHSWDLPEYTINSRKGLKRESTKKVYAESLVEFFDSYRLVFRDVTGPKNMRTVIATIIPPQTFHTYSLRSVVLKKNGMNTIDATYIINILYLCGIMNSLTFDYTARANIQMHLSTIINSLPIPHTTPHKNEISTLVAKMLVGTPEFAGLAERTHIENHPLTVKERIETMAKIDALVAISYDLKVEEYRTIIDSFPAFKKNPNFKYGDEINWNNLNLKEFYGEMAESAMKFFVEITESKK
ncbi:MAG: hypothetical protein OXC46_11600, partial [Thaumarchaeota archaeon]|nr:hypothetical protein [Nitrososphaerota archaeon]